MEYLEGIQGVSEINDGHNPATWMLEMTTPAQELSLRVDFVETYRNSDQYRLATVRFTSYSVLIIFTGFSCPVHGLPVGTTLVLLASLAIFYIETGGYHIGGGGAWVYFLGSWMKTNDGTGSFQLNWINEWKHCATCGVCREDCLLLGKGRRMYSAIPYALAQVVIEIPYIILQTLLYCTMVCAMMGLDWTVGKYFWNLIFMLFTFFYFTYFAMMSVAVTLTINLASIIVTFFYTMWNLFAGFIVPGPSIPIWWRWLYWADPMAWSMYGLVGSRFRDVKDAFEGGTTVEQYVREYFGYKHGFVGVIACGIVGYTVVFAFTYALCVKAFCFQRR